jgi:single-stranded DNA-specific DHH superfamily exonuclease
MLPEGGDAPKQARQPAVLAAEVVPDLAIYAPPPSAQQLMRVIEQERQDRMRVVASMRERHDADLAAERERLPPKARALAILAAHPDWTNTRIAKEAGLARETLERDQRFRTARKFQRQTLDDVASRSLNREDEPKVDEDA